MNKEEYFIEKLNNINDPVVKCIIKLLTNSYNYNKISNMGNEYLLNCDDVKICVIIDDKNNYICIDEIFSEYKRKKFQITYVDEMIIFEREFKDNDIVITRKQEYMVLE